MTRAKVLGVLKQARALLEERYVANRLICPTLPGQPRYCQAGCLGVVLRNDPYLVRYPSGEEEDVFMLVEESARRLYPWQRHSDPGHQPRYPNTAVAVNNRLGKEAILAVYDDAIAQLEVAVLCEREAARNPCSTEEEVPCLC